MTRAAATRVSEQVGVGPEDIDVVELHDCLAQNEHRLPGLGADLNDAAGPSSD